MSRHLTTTYFNKLRDAFAGIYPIRPDIMAAMKAAGLNWQEADMEGRGEIVWSAVLTLAEEKEKVPELILVAKEKRPDSETLKDALLAVENGSAFVTEIRYQDFIRQPSRGAVKCFLVYDNNDITNELVNLFKRQLRGYERFSRRIIVQDMNAGDLAGKTTNELLGKLGESQIAILLLTPNLMSNDTCDPFVFGSKEMVKRVVPVLLESCPWERIELLKDIVPMPTSRQFVSDSTKQGKTITEMMDMLDLIVKDVEQL